MCKNLIKNLQGNSICFRVSSLKIQEICEKEKPLSLIFLFYLPNNTINFSAHTAPLFELGVQV